jgi:hypothetical protein
VPELPPLFSFVATSRNDDHGGDVLRRTQSFVDRLAEQANRHRVRCELILVEWNPPAHVLCWPEGTPWFSARVITASKGVHRSLRHSIPLQMFQMIAKNVGIRRARGDWVIATNIDIIFSDELFQFLKTDNLERNVLYRSDRWDIPNALQLEPSLDDILSRARREVIRKNLRDGTYIRQADGTFLNSTPSRFDDYFVYPVRNQIDHLLKRLTGETCDTGMVRSELLRIRNEFIEEQRRYAAAPLLHTNGCGDFTMLSRYGWGRLRGYPEWHLFSWAIDSVLLYQAHYNGMRIEELPADAVHYHIEHDYGSGWSPEGATSLWERIGRAGIPYLDMDDFRRIVLELDDNATRGEQTIYCGLGWGYGNLDMPEEVVAAPGVPAITARTRNEGVLVEDPTEGMVRKPLELGAATPGGVLVAMASQDEDGLTIHRVSTQGSPWGYALSWDLNRQHRADEFWLEIRARVRSGALGIGVLNHDQSAFVAQANLTKRDDFERITLRVLPGARATELVCRNAGFEAAEIDLHEITVLEPAADSF